MKWGMKEAMLVLKAHPLKCASDGEGFHDAFYLATHIGKCDSVARPHRVARQKSGKPPPTARNVGRFDRRVACAQFPGGCRLHDLGLLGCASSDPADGAVAGLVHPAQFP